MANRSTSIRISDELEKAVRALADEEERSFNKMICILVREALEKRGIPTKPKRRTPTSRQ